MKSIIKLSIAALFVALLNIQSAVAAGSQEVEEEIVKGPNRGRLLEQKGFQLELAIFEDGVPPEFHVYVVNQGQPVDPGEVQLKVVLKRLGGVEDHIQFAADAGFLRGDAEIYEPHSFQVYVEASYQGQRYTWEYDNFEGRVIIEQDIARAMGIRTTVVGSQVMNETIKAYGRVVSPVGSRQQVRARFPGLVKAVHVGLGDKVKAGQRLLTVESNESLKSYSVPAPISGVITDITTARGSNTSDQVLLSILDTENPEVELDIFPRDRAQVKQGQSVLVEVHGLDEPLQGELSYIAPEVKANQAYPARVRLKANTDAVAPGMFAEADITIARYRVDQAVKKETLQAFRDFTVVYAKVGDTYEVRMLELGRSDREWVEVLGGLPANTEYVTDNSFIIKADIDKSGASHDH